MNRFQHDNIDMYLTQAQRDRVLNAKLGINWGMSKKRRAAKQARHRANAESRLEMSGLAGYAIRSRQNNK